MKMKFLFKLVALMTIISVVGCSDDVGVGPKGKLYFSDSKSWKDSGTLIYENFDGSPDKPGGLSIQLCKSEKKEFYIRYSS